MPARYAPLPNPRTNLNPESEMDEAFDDPDPGEEIWEAPSIPGQTGEGVAGTYDFEREYDMPPPGSPPRPSAVALPNDHGNSNGFIPTEPVSVPAPTAPRPSLFRRVMGAMLPTHYTPLPSGETSRVGARGSGIENDGVFANVQAKPSVPKTVQADDGEIYTIPEEVQKEPPPTYADAQADAVPSYWETTIHAPLSGLESGSDMIINDLPSGSFVLFFANLLISYLFAFFGFVITYLFRTSHAAKLGSQAGLGLTLIQYGYYSRGFGSHQPMDWTTDPPPPSTSVPTSDPFSDADFPLPSSKTSMTLRDISAIVLMTLGWFLFIMSCISFWRVKHWERSIRATSMSQGRMSYDQIEREISTRRHVERFFGLLNHDEEGSDAGRTVQVRLTEGDAVAIPDENTLREIRLQRNLIAAGLI